MGIRGFSQGLNLGSSVTDDHVDKLFLEADLNKDGKIDLEEFVKVMKN